MQLSKWKTSVYELGEAQVKHGARIEIFNIFDRCEGHKPVAVTQLHNGMRLFFARVLHSNHIACLNPSTER